MIYHVLPGDSLVPVFRTSHIGGEVVVCRECFVAGDLDGDTLDELWERRGNFIGIEYGGDPIEYRESVAGELEKLLEVAKGDQVNLWFEFELFCSANMWFCLDLLKNSEADIFRVMPIETSPEDVWAGFEKYGPDDLIRSYDARIQFSKEDTNVATRLWNAFRDRDYDAIRELSSYRSTCFPFLKEVCNAAAEIDREPIEIVRDLKAAGFGELSGLFREFQKRAGVYGFGDAQVASLTNRA